MSEANNSEKQPSADGPVKDRLFDFSFNRSVKLRAETSTITANGGVLLLREVDHRLNITNDIANNILDHRMPELIRYPVAELVRERVFAIALGYAHQDDADIVAHDPAFKTAVWGRSGQNVVDERLASQPTASRLISMLAPDPNREELRKSLALPILRHQRSKVDRPVRLGVVDIDGHPIEVHGDQPGAEYSGYYKKDVYSPMAAYFSSGGTFDSSRLGEGFLHAQLRNGNASAAEGAKDFIDAVIVKARELAKTVDLRMDAGFAGADTLNHANKAGVRFTARLPDNTVLARLAVPFLKRPQGRPQKEGREFAIELKGYRNPKWDETYRVILVVSDRPGKDGHMSLFGPHHFFLVTNWPRKNRRPGKVLKHYRRRGTFEDRIGEWKALRVRLSQDSFEKNEVTYLLSMLSFNLLGIIRGETESARDSRPNPPHTPKDSGWDMGRVQNVLLKAGAILSRGGRRLWFDLAEGLASLWTPVLERLRRWRNIPGVSPAQAYRNGFTPLPPHAFRSYTPRL
jgi:hypothetical protein